jgi:Tfp pilus tip-associated adhesin PilY1
VGQFQSNCDHVFVGSDVKQGATENRESASAKDKERERKKRTMQWRTETGAAIGRTLAGLNNKERHKVCTHEKRA